MRGVGEERRSLPPTLIKRVRPDLVPGGRFPDLTLPDHRGEPVRLSKLANGFPLILSFYRGYW